MKFDEFKQKAIAVLADCPMKASDIAYATGANQSSTYNWLKKLVISGDIVKGEDGVYRLATNEELSEALIQEKVNEFMEQHFKPVEVEVIEEYRPQACMTVGQSQDRTYGKHKLLNKSLGRLVGAFTKVRFLKPPFFFIDLCAGDGQPSYYSDWSSPQIIDKHAGYLRQRMGEDAAIVILIEKDRTTFDKLQKAFPANKNTYLIHGDSKDPLVVSQVGEIIKTHGNLSSPCFVHNDPNKVADWAITSVLLEVLPRYTTSLTTMGCNVSGLKRLDLESREKWFEHVQVLAQSVKAVKCHDAYLASLRNDKAQWAYLVTAPAKWTQDVVSDVKKAFKDWPHGVEGAWLSEVDQFVSLIRRLFLTKKEWEGGQDVA